MVEFQKKIDELEFLHKRVQAERSALEAGIKQRSNFKKILYEVKAQYVVNKLKLTQIL